MPRERAHCTPRRSSIKTGAFPSASATKIASLSPSRDGRHCEAQPPQQSRELWRRRSNLQEQLAPLSRPDSPRRFPQPRDKLREESRLRGRSGGADRNPTARPGSSAGYCRRRPHSPAALPPAILAPAPDLRDVFVVEFDLESEARPAQKIEKLN